MKLGILGHFGEGLVMLNGQTVKTKNLVDSFEKYTDAEVVKIDSHGWIKRPLGLLKNIKSAFCECDCIIMLPAHNGVKVFSPLLAHYKKKYKKKIFYDVIGGWLPKLLESKRSLAKTLRTFDGIWVETNTMKQRLEAQGFENVTVVPNFKELTPLSVDTLVYPKKAPYKLCTFSRVMREKGIKTAADVVKSVNEGLGYTAYTFDIYGQIDGPQTEWFEELQATFPEYIRYLGCVDSSKSVEILKDYFALLFPTHFYTEGIPGTIIDAYAAGIPVISAKWESFSDVVDDGVCGVGYEFDNKAALEDILIRAAREPSLLLDMKPACIQKAQDYMPATATKIMTEEFGA